LHTDKAAQIEAIAEQVRGLEASLLYVYRQENGYQPVIGEGSLDADVGVGQAYVNSATPAARLSPS